MRSCTECQTTGFLNSEQLPATINGADHDAILKWITANESHDVQVCDCCGDGERWYGTPGVHYNQLDPPGMSGPYDYNGGLCKCH